MAAQRAGHHAATVLTAMAHVIVTEGLVNEKFVQERCELDAFQEWAAFVAEERNSPEAVAKYTGVDPAELRAAARLYATGGNGAICFSNFSSSIRFCSRACNESARFRASSEFSRALSFPACS